MCSVDGCEWKLSMDFLTKFIEKKISDCTKDIVMKPDGTFLIPPPELKFPSELKKLFFNIFNDEWFQINEPLFGIEEKQHPLSYIIHRHMHHYLQCMIETFDVFIELIGVDFIRESERIISSLQDSSAFHHTLFELDILGQLTKCGFSVDPDFVTTGNKNVEAKIEKNNNKFLVECKSLHTSDETKRIRERLMRLNKPFDINIKYSVAFKKFPNDSVIESIKQEIDEHQQNKTSGESSTDFYDAKYHWDEHAPLTPVEFR